MLHDVHAGVKECTFARRLREIEKSTTRAPLTVFWWDRLASSCDDLHVGGTGHGRHDSGAHTAPAPVTATRINTG